MNEKLLQLINDVDDLEGFIKGWVFDRHQPKIEAQTGKEILRLISEMKGRALK